MCMSVCVQNYGGDYLLFYTFGGYTHSEFHAIALHGYGKTPLKFPPHSSVCVTTYTMPVHMHGTNFEPF